MIYSNGAPGAGSKRGAKSEAGSEQPERKNPYMEKQPSLSKEKQPKQQQQQQQKLSPRKPKIPKISPAKKKGGKAATGTAAAAARPKAGDEPAKKKRKQNAAAGPNSGPNADSKIKPMNRFEKKAAAVATGMRVFKV